MKKKDRRICVVCGTQFPASKELCPVCMLREALDEEIKLAEASLENHSAASGPGHPAHRFEHYELATDEDGKPIELGRGAMGITYKAFDVDLRLYVVLLGQWRYSISTATLPVAMQAAKRVYALTQLQNDPTVMIATTLRWQSLSTS